MRRRAIGAVVVLLVAACSAPEARQPPDATARAATASPSSAGKPAGTSSSTPTPRTTAADPSTTAPRPTVSASARPTSRGSGASPGTTAPAFVGTIAPIDAALRARMVTSWRPGCPVPLEQLRYLRVSHVDLAGRVRVGEIVVSARVAPQVVQVFRELYAQRFPIRSLRLVDDFGGSDEASMAADNSSGFNCRPVTGGTRFSEHATGEAIDLNPRENPYVSRDGQVQPDAGRVFLDRRPAPGVVTAGGPVVAAFARTGWSWGGTWTAPTDYQHFSRSGR